MTAPKDESPAKPLLIRDNKWWMIYSAIVATISGSYMPDYRRAAERADEGWRYARALPDREPEDKT